MVYEDNKNTIYCGDNLSILKNLKDESVKMIYIDLPFNTKKPQAGCLTGGTKIEYNDRWNGTLSYLDYMMPRLEECPRLLAQEGSFWVHCDWHADAYLRVRLDKIFKKNHGKFLGVIYWHHADRVMDSKRFFPDKTDTILVYAKSSQFKFYKSDKYLRVQIKDKGRYNKIDENGRHYALVFKNGKHSKILFKEDGRLLTNVWEFPSIRGNSKEYTGYPTQKPEELFEIIIRSTTKLEDTILDPFCGCGPSLVVARRLGRFFIGIDEKPEACMLSASRTNIPIHDIIGIKLTDDELHALPWTSYQKYNCSLMHASCILHDRDGIDGITFGTGYPIQVKQYVIQKGDVADFYTNVEREGYKKVKYGGIIGFDKGRNVIEEIARIRKVHKFDIRFFSTDDVKNGKQFTDNFSVPFEFPQPEPIQPIKKELPQISLDKWKEYITSNKLF